MEVYASVLIVEAGKPSKKSDLGKRSLKRPTSSPFKWRIGRTVGVQHKHKLSVGGALHARFGADPLTLDSQTPLSK